MKYFKICSLFVAGVVFLFSFNNTLAQTDIYGDEADGIYHISTDTVWTKDASPYVVYDDVSLDSGATLTIEAGTVVKFEESRYLEVFGKLVVNGTASEKVSFTSLYDDTILGDTDGDGGDWLPEYSPWGGIEILTGGSYDIKNANILYTDFALGSYFGAGFFDSVKISESKNGVFLYESVLDVRNSSFSNILRDALTVYSTSTASMTSSDINNIDRIGFFVFENSHLVLSNSTVKNIYGNNVFEVFNNSSADIDYVSISNVYGYRVGEFFNGVAIKINNSIIENSFVETAIESFTNSNLSFLSSTISNVSDRAAISFFDCEPNPSSVLNIMDSSIEGEIGKGLEIFCPTRAEIKNTKLKNFSGDGIQAFSDPIITISDSEISGNNNGIESWGADIEIKNSSIKSNLSFGISNNPVGSALPIRAAGNWWGDSSGPFNEISNASGTANKVSENVEFIPWLLNLPGSKPDCCSNVFFIPGLQSSRLYKKGLLSVNQLWEPNRNADVEKLYLDSNGNSLDTSIYTNDIIERTNVGMGIFDQNIYKKFFDTMDSIVTEKKINGWEAVPYDWRFDINKIVSDGVKMADGSTLNFVDEFMKMASSSATGKVTIVTHSNGGLIAKVLINELKARGQESLVDKLIMVAVPQLGTPEAVVGLLHGDGQELAGGFILSKTTARTLYENMMGAYNLLPEDVYFSKMTKPIIKFDESVDLVDDLDYFRDKYGDDINSFSELKKFLLGNDGRAEPKNTDITMPNILKTNLLSLAEINHANIDTWVAPENIKVIQLAGWGVNTVSGIEYFGRKTCAVGFTYCVPTVVLDRRPIYTEDGDETVVTESALAMDEAERYYLDMKTFKQGHKDILEATSSVQFVTNFVLNNNQSIPEYISKEKPVSADKMVEIALHSPVSIDIYDEFGNHTGLVNNPNPNSDLQLVEENIPGSSYINFGEGKYVLLPEAEYNIKLKGLDYGTFTLETKTTQGGADIASSTFTDTPTSPSMIGNVVLGTTTSNSVINIDTDGDNKNDFIVDGNQDFDPVTYLQMLKKTIETFDASKKTKNELKKEIDSIIKLLQKDRIILTILKVKLLNLEILKNMREKRNEKDWNNNKPRLYKDDAKALLALLNRLLDNLVK